MDNILKDGLVVLGLLSPQFSINGASGHKADCQRHYSGTQVRVDEIEVVVLTDSVSELAQRNKPAIPAAASKTTGPAVREVRHRLDQRECGFRHHLLRKNHMPNGLSKFVTIHAGILIQ